MDIDIIRKDFPLTERLVYLDSAATSLTPEPVLNSMLEYYRGYRANVGRGVYQLAQLADQRYRKAHQKVASLIGAGENEVAFTKNSTEAINMVAGGLRWKKGDKVITTLVEHHSNLLPWLRLQDKGVNVQILQPDKNGLFLSSQFEEAMDKETKLVAVTHISNVLGTVLPIKEISEICQDRGAMLLVDAAQSVPHMPVDVKEIGCQFLCFSGHKMLGPTGTGGLWMEGGLEEALEPLIVGGGMVEEVSLQGYVTQKGYSKFEAGTPHISGGVGMGAAVDYLHAIGMEEIAAHERLLSKKLLEGLLEIETVEIYGPLESKERSGLVSFNVRGIEPHQVALILDQVANILVRSGHHCAMPLMKHLGLKDGSVRASLYLYNTEEEVYRLLAMVEEIARTF